MTFTSSDAIK